MELFSNPALIWFIVGVVLLLLELIIPGLFILFFGLGAIVTSICVFLFDPSLTMQFLIFSITSVLSLVFLRKVLMQKMYKKNRVDPDEEFIGNMATCIGAIEKDGEGKVEYKGTNWTATSTSAVQPGQKVKIINKEGLRLIVEPVS